VLLDYLVEEVTDHPSRVCADEPGDRLAGTEDGDGRDALDSVACREHLLSVDVDLGEADLVIALLDLRLDRGAERAPIRMKRAGTDLFSLP
jgi:hypothetical protein